jgi:hypothetical protein
LPPQPLLMNLSSNTIGAQRSMSSVVAHADAGIAPAGIGSENVVTRSVDVTVAAQIWWSLLCVRRTVQGLAACVDKQRQRCFRGHVSQLAYRCTASVCGPDAAFAVVAARNGATRQPTRDPAAARDRLPLF